MRTRRQALTATLVMAVTAVAHEPALHEPSTPRRPMQTIVAVVLMQNA